MFGLACIALLEREPLAQVTYGLKFQSEAQFTRLSEKNFIESNL